MQPLPVSAILPPHSQEIIHLRKKAELSQVYHELDAPKERQLKALDSGMILLSNWELLIFSLFKSLTQLGPFSRSCHVGCHYFESKMDLLDDVVNHLTDEERVQRLRSETKMDKHRMLVILLARLLKRLIINAQQSIDHRGGKYAQALRQFCYIAQEFLIEPVIAADRLADARGAHSKDAALVELCTSTPALEFLHCMIKLLQDPELIFQRPQRSNPNEHAERAIHQVSAPTQWRADSLLAQLKPRLYLFFQAGFRLASRERIWPQVRLCDFAKLYMEVLTPWAPNSFFLDRCLIMQEILVPLEESSKVGSMLSFGRGDQSRQANRSLRQDIFQWLTHHSVPMTILKEEPAMASEQGDASMASHASARNFSLIDSQSGW